MNAKLKVSVLCPGFIRTRILESERNRPPELRNEADQPDQTPEAEAVRQTAQALIQAGMPPEQVADIVFEAVANEKFYILPNAEGFREAIKIRMEDILQERNPTI
jgi:short-subunit dehydrogenase